MTPRARLAAHHSHRLPAWDLIPFHGSAQCDLDPLGRPGQPVRCPKTRVRAEPVVAEVSVAGPDGTDATGRRHVTVRAVRIRIGSETHSVARPSPCSRTRTHAGPSAVRAPTVPANQKFTAVTPSGATLTPCCALSLARTPSQPVSAARAAVAAAVAPGIRT